MPEDSFSVIPTPGVEMEFREGGCLPKVTQQLSESQVHLTESRSSPLPQPLPKPCGFESVFLTSLNFRPQIRSETPVLPLKSWVFRANDFN